ncbi:MAG: SPASM domain-containing protein [Candidatus Moraniibacteriota bacterium]|nr:MAG: SPASM domain-containing protein [Candidatus Moranbacteria bacterium]
MHFLFPQCYFYSRIMHQFWSRRSSLFMGQCQECVALGICGGGCPLQADIEKGSIWELDDRFCVHSKRTLEWLIWDLYEKMVK